MLLTVAARADLKTTLDEIVNRDAFATGIVGVAILDPTSGEWLYEHYADTALQPASTTKTLSCAYALETLGPDYRFHTPLAAPAPADENGVLHGPVYLVGKGDPFTFPGNYRALAEAVAKAGVKRIEGGMRADVTRFEGRRWGSGWTVDDLAYWYGSLPDAICFDRQRVYFTFRPGEVGAKALVETGLPGEALTYENLTTTVEAGGATDVWAQKTLAENHYVLTGTIAADAKPETIRVALDDPGLTALQYLRARLRELGVEVEGDIAYGKAPDGCVEIAAMDSEPLSKALWITLKYSDNLAAELMAWNTSVETGHGPYARDAIAAMTEWLKGRDLPMRGLVVSDGSGLSRYDRLTARFLAAHMAKMMESPHFEVFKDCLPLAGVDGTIKSRFAGTPLEGKVHAKTGTIMRVASLTGYAPGPDGHDLVFALMFNGFDCGDSEVYKAQTEIITALMDGS